MRASQLTMFGANVFLLIGLLIAAAVALGLLIAAWTGIRWWWWKRDERRAQAAYHRDRFGPDGTPLPRAARGICDVCGELHERVRHLPGGERLCPRHYAARDGTGAGEPRADTGET